MKAISLWQPWASLVVLGSKTIETRHWSTNYRGPLLIHAAKRLNRQEMWAYQQDQQFMSAFHKMGKDANLFQLPFGAIVGMVDLVDCRPSESFRESMREKIWAKYDWHTEDEMNAWWTEEHLGNFEPGRFGWVLENPVAYEGDRIVPYKGSQGFFEVSEELTCAPF